MKTKTFLYILLSLVLTAATMFLAAFVVTQLWGWFISPLGVATINLWWAFGICLTVRVVAGIRQPKDPDDEKKTVSDIFTGQIAEIIGVLLVWGAGALVALGV